MSRYDAWLERPMTMMIDEIEQLVDAYDDWCADHDRDPMTADEDHPDHHLFQQWSTWAVLWEAWWDELVQREVDALGPEPDWDRL